MKKLGIIAAALLFLASCSNTDTKYKIEADGGAYYTDSYSSSGNCITFQHDCGCGSEKMESVTVCGTYTITER